ncbi:pectinesterase family protein [Caulobacter segnis]|uniref:pectinesterase family protein n=1 Tax=Caulobacter segnis TaxID=88688 RepID=UPI0024109C36|nr:pectinesterase family protein [Caulobacter segnis]MDG2522116.1 pectinesterase family protein [Caulobacter segnis]
MKPIAGLSFGLLLALAPAAIHAQDTLVGMGHINGYTGVVFDTRNERYDYLVDASLPEDPAARRYRTVEAAYAAAPAGTPGKPTVIGIRPDVYLLPGKNLTPGLVITKPNITLLGLTDDRRKVVLADNRGNQQGAGVLGASNNGFTMIVDADGFSAINLTILNYCNTDYDYPGDPSKSLKKRSDVITQAVALEAKGDRHVYSHVAILSRLDTLFTRTKRSYFTHVYVEGTDDFIGGGAASVWEDSEVHFINGGGVMWASGVTFIRTVFKAEKPMQFYKISGPPVALIDSVLPNTQVAWYAWKAPEHAGAYSLTYRTRHVDGRPAEIIDSIVGSERRVLSRELSAEEAKAFNPWNILRATPEGVEDGWDPAGVREKHAGEQPSVFRMVMNGEASRIRTGEKGAVLSVNVQPAAAQSQPIRWSTRSKLVKLSAVEGREITVSGANTTDQVEMVAVDAIAANGMKATAHVRVEPAYGPSPTFTSAPRMSSPSGGVLSVNYGLNLSPRRRDQSLVSWSLCDDRACGSSRPVAVSRGGEPLKRLPLTAGMIGGYLRAEIAPKHDLSEAGPSVSVVSANPVAARDVSAGGVDPDFRSFVEAVDLPQKGGLWSLTGAWSVVEPQSDNGRWGLRVGPKISTAIYGADRPVGDMDLTVTLDPDKGEGQGFSIPGSPEDAKGPRGDILFKYDPKTQTGYALRMWRTTQSATATMFQLYRIVDGKGQPLDDAQQLTGVFKPSTTIKISVRGDKVSVQGANTVDGETLSLDGRITQNSFGGGGVYWTASGLGGSTVIRQFKITYP